MLGSVYLTQAIPFFMHDTLAGTSMFYHTVTAGHSPMLLLCRTDLIAHQQTTLGKCCYGRMHVDWLFEISVVLHLTYATAAVE